MTRRNSTAGHMKSRNRRVEPRNRYFIKIQPKGSIVSMRCDAIPFDSNRLELRGKSEKQGLTTTHRWFLPLHGLSKWSEMTDMRDGILPFSRSTTPAPFAPPSSIPAKFQPQLPLKSAGNECFRTALLTLNISNDQNDKPNECR